jgi:hypothetical protein
MSQYSRPRQRFSDFVNKEKGVLEDSEDDMPFEKRRNVAHLEVSSIDSLDDWEDLVLFGKSKRTPSPDIPAPLPAIDCAVSIESLEPDSFLQHPITPSCDHKPTTCSSCLTQSIESQISDKPWDQISCPECLELVLFDSVKEIVSQEAFERYVKFAQKFSIPEMV